MSATRSTAGETKVLARDESAQGTRQLVGQRVNGTVHLSDVPAGEQGRVHLVERGLGCLKELDALVRDYLAKAEALGRCPMAHAAWWD
jgi:hypothetical protein